MSDDLEPRTVKARVSDPELLAALEEAEESQSMASAVRDGLRVTLLDNNESTGDSGLSPIARKGYRALRERADGSGIISKGARAPSAKTRWSKGISPVRSPKPWVTIRRSKSTSSTRPITKS